VSEAAHLQNNEV